MHGLAILLGRIEAGISNRGKIFLQEPVLCAVMGSIIPSRLGCCIDFPQNIHHLVPEAGPRWIPFGQADDSGSVGSGLALLVLLILSARST